MKLAACRQGLCRPEQRYKLSAGGNDILDEAQRIPHWRSGLDLPSIYGGSPLTETWTGLGSISKCPRQHSIVRNPSMFIHQHDNMPTITFAHWAIDCRCVQSRPHPNERNVAGVVKPPHVPRWCWQDVELGLSLNSYESMKLSEARA